MTHDKELEALVREFCEYYDVPFAHPDTDLFRESITAYTEKRVREAKQRGVPLETLDDALTKICAAVDVWEDPTLGRLRTILEDFQQDTLDQADEIDGWVPLHTMAEAVQKEREACARIVDGAYERCCNVAETAAAIRARGQRSQSSDEQCEGGDGE